MDFEEDIIDWRVLAVEWDGAAEEMVVWYYDVDMAADACYTEEDMHLARAEGLDLEPLELSSVKEVKQWIRSRGGE